MKRNLATGSILTVLVVLTALALFSNRLTSGEPAPPRRIVLEARDLAFGADNPTIHLAPGERVRLVVRNSDPGILHSISIPGIDSEVRHVKYGEQVTLEFVAPEGGTFDYVCPQHAPKMRGKLVIDPFPERR